MPEGGTVEEQDDGFASAPENTGSTLKLKSKHCVSPEKSSEA